MWMKKHWPSGQRHLSQLLSIRSKKSVRTVSHQIDTVNKKDRRKNRKEISELKSMSTERKNSLRRAGQIWTNREISKLEDWSRLSSLRTRRKRMKKNDKNLVRSWDRPGSLKNHRWREGWRLFTDLALALGVTIQQAPQPQTCWSGMRTYHPVRPFSFWHVFHPGCDNLKHTVPRRSVQLTEIIVEGKICFLDKRQPVVHHGPVNALSVGFNPHEPGRVGRVQCPQGPSGDWEAFCSCFRLLDSYPHPAGLTRKQNQARWPGSGMPAHLDPFSLLMDNKPKD